MQLSEVQRLFKETILDHPDVVANPPSDLAAVFETGDIALSDRLAVYRNNVVGSLTDVMLASFTTIEKLVGEEFFMGMARSFILAHPPTHGCLNFYGHGFARFIEEFEPAKGLPYLPDIARLEMALNDAYYAKDDAVLGNDELAAIPPEDLGNVQVFPRACVKLITSPYPIHDIRDFALSDDGDQKDQLDINSGAAHLMVYRPQLDTQIIILDEGEYTMLDNLQSLMPLGAAAEDVLNRYADFDISAFLQKHIFLETFSTLDPNI